MTKSTHQEPYRRCDHGGTSQRNRQWPWAMSGRGAFADPDSAQRLLSAAILKAAEWAHP